MRHSASLLVGLRLALACPAAAQTVAPSVAAGRAFAPVSLAWGVSIRFHLESELAPLKGMPKLLGALQALDIQIDEQRQRWAPVVEALRASGITPGKFAAAFPERRAELLAAALARAPAVAGARAAEFRALVADAAAAPKALSEAVSSLEDLGRTYPLYLSQDDAIKNEAGISAGRLRLLEPAVAAALAAAQSEAVTLAARLAETAVPAPKPGPRILSWKLRLARDPEKRRELVNQLWDCGLKSKEPRVQKIVSGALRFELRRSGAPREKVRALKALHQTALASPSARIQRSAFEAAFAVGLDAADTQVSKEGLLVAGSIANFSHHLSVVRRARALLRREIRWIYIDEERDSLDAMLERIERAIAFKERDRKPPWWRRMFFIP